MIPAKLYSLLPKVGELKRDPGMLFDSMADLPLLHVPPAILVARTLTAIGLGYCNRLASPVACSLAVPLAMPGALRLTRFNFLEQSYQEVKGSCEGIPATFPQYLLLVTLPDVRIGLVFANQKGVEIGRVQTEA